MKTALSQIATLQSGVFAKPDKDGEVFYLQAKHFNEEGVLSQVLYPELKLSGKVKKFLLQDGDVLFAAKGAKNFAVTYRSEYGPAVASSTFLVVRLNKKFMPLLLPDFLAWYMNNPKNMGKLKSAATGTSMPSISTSVLKDMEIAFPSVAKQQTILKIQALRTKEISLRVQIETLRETLVQTQLIHASMD